MIEEFTKTLSLLLQGKIPEPLDIEELTDDDELDFASRLNQLIVFMEEIHEFVNPLSKGELTEIEISPQNFLGSPFKELHSRLLHLTWQANQVANGDYNQRVDFMGEFSEAFNNMVVSLKIHEQTLKKKIAELEQALSHILLLEGILPICSYCKKIRREGTDPEDPGNWMPVEYYISEKTDARFSHSICPECMEKYFSDLEI